MDQNQSRYQDAGVALYYGKQAGIWECERVLFERYIAPGSSVLDIGVGGGRTTAALAALAGRYVGLDYSQAMVAECRKRFPALEFVHGDATAMTMIPDDSFDTVVFSFNGIDSIPDAAGRMACLKEIARVLKPGGNLIFSSHNAQWLFIWPRFEGAHGPQIPWRILRSIFKSPAMAFKAIVSGRFGAGEGYFNDPIHGGLFNYASTPETMMPQCEAAGLQVLDTIGSQYPRVSSRYLTPWIYYACRKSPA